MTVAPRPLRDLLATPGLRRLLLWKHNRTALQIALFAVAVIMVLDGWLGSRLANQNTATVAAWVYYRGSRGLSVHSAAQAGALAGATVAALTVTAAWIFLLPMEMRGNVLG